MKSLRNLRQQHANTERSRSAKRSEKYSKLDRKSSRGMIYENEELRLRTININAEVERGQTDIKRLRKENEQLRREIWTLRDECDRLNKRVKAKFIEHEQGVYNARCSGGNSCPYQYNDGGDASDGAQSRCNNEDSDSCDSCCCQEEDISTCNDECCNERKELTNTAEDEGSSTVDSPNGTVSAAAATESATTSTSKSAHFDHLSVVSEETLSNSEVVSAQQAENRLHFTSDLSASQATLPSLVGPLTPLTPVELVANELHDLQSAVPPLSYFENILQQHMSTNYGSTPESSSTTNSGKTIVKHTNGWDYKLESPFVQRKYPDNSISPIMTKRLPAQTLTTFVPSTAAAPPASPGMAILNEKPTLPKKPTELSVNTQQHPIIETVPIQTMPSSHCGQQRAVTNENGDDIGNTTPKHFFSPIKPKLKLNTALANQKRLPESPVLGNEAITPMQSLVPHHKCEPPDIYVTNALATPYRPPNKPILQPPPIPQRIANTSTIKAQTDSANLESILNDIEAISEDILAIQFVKQQSRDKIEKKSTDSINKIEQTSLQQDNKNTKPYRSEMNLLLTYDGDNPTIKEAETATATNTDNTNAPESIISNSNTVRRTKSLERDHNDTPSPHIPDPMQPFPENRKYIGFDRINKVAVIATTTTPIVAATGTQTSSLVNSPLVQRPQLPLSPLVTNINTPKFLNNSRLPPTPPTRSYPTSSNIKCTGVARSSSVAGCLTATQDSSTNSPVLAGVPPNKSQLYTSLANAAAKRAQFRSQPTQMSRSLDVDKTESVNETNKIVTSDEKEALENIRRKARKVSIVCADTDSPGSPENPIPIGFELTASGSCTDLHAILSNPALQNLRQTSQSTPNSPHSTRKRESSPLQTTTTTTVPPTISITANSTPHHQRNSSNASGMSQLLAHNHAHSNSYPNVISPLSQQQKVRKNSQDVIKSSAAEIACAAANVMRSKCSRRHSDSTVSHTNQRISGASGATNGTHHHHLHNHHHRQHSSSLVSNTNPHHSRRDSNRETVASYSDRNSNSLASSRESSASFSMRSQRRKLSVSSHTGGKIPWCGCWGNGCL